MLCVVVLLLGVSVGWCVSVEALLVCVGWWGAVAILRRAALIVYCAACLLVQGSGFMVWTSRVELDLPELGVPMKKASGSSCVAVCRWCVCSGKSMGARVP